MPDERAIREFIHEMATRTGWANETLLIDCVAWRIAGSDEAAYPAARKSVQAAWDKHFRIITGAG